VFGLKKRLHVVEAFKQARDHLQDSGAAALKVAMERGEEFIINPDVFGMRGRRFPGNWATACFLFARSLEIKECDRLCSLALHESPHFSDIEVIPLLKKRFGTQRSKIDEEPFVRSIFEYTFNKNAGVKETLRPEKVPVSGAVIRRFESDIRYLRDLGRSYNIHT
jgi:hypothetical protein